MNSKQLVETYPTLYHMAEANTWESIQRHGLLSTSGLLDLFKISGDERRRIESQRRSSCIDIHHPRYGSVRIRDNLPMSDSALDKCLQDMKRQEWYENLNRRVFFWLQSGRLERLLGARAYNKRLHCIIEVETAELVRRHGPKISLSPINSGSTIFRPVARGSQTFQRISEYDYDDHKKKRGRANAIVELAVDYAVPDIRELALRVYHWQHGSQPQLLWRRE